jgi:hypothetical protein
VLLIFITLLSVIRNLFLQNEDYVHHHSAFRSHFSGRAGYTELFLCEADLPAVAGSDMYLAPSGPSTQMAADVDLVLGVQV